MALLTDQCRRILTARLFCTVHGCFRAEPLRFKFQTFYRRINDVSAVRQVSLVTLLIFTIKTAASGTEDEEKKSAKPLQVIGSEWTGCLQPLLDPILPRTKTCSLDN